MFTEYPAAGIISGTGVRQNGRDWRDLMTENRFSAANQGPAFGKILMRLFAQTKTNVRQSRHMPDDAEKRHPLGITIKGRYFEHCVSNEREICPRYLDLNKRGGNYETYQYITDTGESIVCENCRQNELPSEATYLGIASEIVKKRLRTGTTTSRKTDI